jgi:hypothetical protein
MIAPDVMAATAMQDAKDQPASATAQANADELRELGETLKAAVLSGTLSEEDAVGIYKTIASRLDTGTTTAEAKDYTGPYSAKLDVIMLSPPRPQQISALFQAEFLRRDLPVLREELDLHQDEMMIAQVLFSDYLDAFDLASTPLREALRRYQRSTTDKRIAAALDRAQIAEVDVAVANTRDALEWLARGADEKGEAGDASSGATANGDEKRAAREAWARRMLEVTAKMGDRLASLRERVQADLAELERHGAAVTADDLVRMARRLRDERAQLRAEMTESLGLIRINEQAEGEKARFEMAMARLRIEQLLPQGRLGGEPMNLWAALTETARSRGRRYGQMDRLEDAEEMLRERASWIAEKLDGRTEATLDREVLGLEFQAARDRIAAANGGSIFGVDQNRLARELRPFAAAARHEVATSVTVRDALLTLLEESSAYIDEVHPGTGLATTYREAALRRGFPTEMRRQWSERALAAALRLDDLDDETRGGLLAIETETSAQLRTLRADAIAKRIERDPRLAREQIDARFRANRKEKIWFTAEQLLGFNHAAFASIDERIENQLSAILAPEQMKTLPARINVLSSSEDAK